MGDSRLPPEYLALATAGGGAKDTSQNEPVPRSPLPSPVHHIYMLLTNWAAVFTPA